MGGTRKLRLLGIGAALGLLAAAVVIWQGIGGTPDGRSKMESAAEACDYRDSDFVTLTGGPTALIAEEADSIACVFSALDSSELVKDAYRNAFQSAEGSEEAKRVSYDDRFTYTFQGSRDGGFFLILTREDTPWPVAWR